MIAGSRSMAIVFLVGVIGALLASPGLLIAFARPGAGLGRYNVAQLAESISCSLLPPGRYFFLRTTGDEAASALGAAQFSSWLMARLISAIVRPLGTFRDSPFAMVMAALLVPWGGIIPMITLVDVYYAKARGPIDVAWWATEIAHTVASFYTPAWWLGLMVSAGVCLFAAAVVYCILWIVCCLGCWFTHLSFGRSAFATALFIDLAVDAVPLGEHVLMRAPWSGLPSDGLLHSSPHQSVLGLDALSNWAGSIVRDGVKTTVGPRMATPAET